MKVTVTEFVRARAMAQVLHYFNLRIGGRVHYRDLAETWRSETGLRHGDLRLSLDELEAIGGLRFHESRDGLLVELTEAGAHALDGPELSLGDLFRLLHSGWVLMRTRRRSRRATRAQSGASAFPARRAADKSLPA
jgi:hypothetical protein